MDTKMDIKTATQIVDNPPPINWEWLAGFFQAEGCVSHNSGHPKLSITQKDRQALELINHFLETELTYRAGLYVQVNEATNLEISQGKVVAQFLLHTTPYLRANKRYIESILPKPFGWDFVAGFWEGDGSVYRREYGGLHYSFNQKDAELLKEVREFLNVGGLYQATNKKSFADGTIHQLHVYDGSKTLNITRTILKHTRTHARRMQIVLILVENGLEL